MAATGFLDDFSGPTLNPRWQASLPTMNEADPDAGLSAAYIGAPNYSFQTLGSDSVLRLNNSMAPHQRVGWSTTDTYSGAFRYEVRFNTLNQSGTTSIDSFLSSKLAFSTRQTLRVTILRLLTVADLAAHGGSPPAAALTTLSTIPSTNTKMTPGIEWSWRATLGRIYELRSLAIPELNWQPLTWPTPRMHMHRDIGCFSRRPWVSLSRAANFLWMWPWTMRD